MLVVCTRTWEVIVHHQFHGRNQMRLGMAYLHLSFNAYSHDKKMSP